MEALINDPDWDVTSIKVDPRLSTLKPRHAKVMTNMYQNHKSEKGKEISKAGWREAGITDVLKEAWNGNGNTISLNPFVWYERYVCHILSSKGFLKLIWNLFVLFFGFFLYWIWMYFSKKKFCRNYKFALIRYHLNIWLFLIRVNYHPFWNPI